VSSNAQPLTVMFLPESAYGPTNQCIGVGDVLLQHGHRVVFAAESSWSGKLSKLGFVEDLVDLAPPPENADEQDAGQFWKDFIRETAPQFRRPTVEQLATFIQPTWQALIDGAKYCQPQLLDIIARQQPDIIVEDNVVAFPALMTAGVPFVRIVSCNPLEIGGKQLPPVFSGYPVDDDSQWAAFRAEYDRTHREMWTDFNDWVQAQGASALPDLEFMHESPDANLYVFPQELDYTDIRPLGPSWHRIDSSVRGTDEPFELPAQLVDRPADSSLVYLSLGSLGSADVDLMKRLVSVLGQTRHRYIVSTGPQHDQYQLADNMWGAEFLPQTRIVPLVDLVITHGGNNTTTEAMHFGKPMIVLPLFWDQYDNAQRVHETGYGIRLATYDFAAEQLTSAIDRLLSDQRVHQRLSDAAAAIQARDGLREAARIVEAVGQRSRA